MTDNDTILQKTRKSATFNLWPKNLQHFLDKKKLKASYF